MLCEKREPDVVKCCKLLLSLAGAVGMGTWLFLNYRHYIYDWGGHIQNNTHVISGADEVVEWFTIGNATLVVMGLMMCCCSQFKVCASKPSDPSDRPLLENPSINEFEATIKTSISNASPEVQDLINQIKESSMKRMLSMPKYYEIIRHYISLLASPNATVVDIPDQRDGVTSGHGLYSPPPSATMNRNSTPTPSHIDNSSCITSAGLNIV